MEQRISGGAVEFQTFRQDISLVEVLKYISLIVTSAGNF